MRIDRFNEFNNKSDINWKELPMNSKLNLLLLEDDFTEHTIEVLIKEYEWLPTREPYIVDLEVTNIINSNKLNVGNILRLPILTHQEEGFLVFAPYNLHPNNQIKMHAKIYLK
jgi:hypothetical protein